jgi:glycosyltransferase involved in cell wall biosynthesis
MKSLLCAVESFVHGPAYRGLIDHFIVPSSYAKGIAVQAGLPAHKISVVRWGVDPIQRPDLFQSDELQRPYFFFGGRLELTKGIDFVLNLWNRSGLRKSFDLVIAGDGSLLPLVLRAAATDETIKYVGQIAQHNVLAYAASAFLCLMPSRQPESYGLFAAEVLRAGGRLMHSGRGALAEFLESDLIYVEELNVDVWATAICSMISQTGSRRSFHRDSADSGIASVSVMVDGVEEIYRRASASRSASRM